MSLESGRVVRHFVGEAKGQAGKLYRYEATWTLDGSVLRWSAIVAANGLLKALPTGQIAITSRSLAGGVQTAVRAEIEHFVEGLDATTQSDVRESHV